MPHALNYQHNLNQALFAPPQVKVLTDSYVTSRQENQRHFQELTVKIDHLNHALKEDINQLKHNLIEIVAQTKGVDDKINSTQDHFEYKIDQMGRQLNDKLDLISQQFGYQVTIESEKSTKKMLWVFTGILGLFSSLILLGIRLLSIS